MKRLRYRPSSSPAFDHLSKKTLQRRLREVSTKAITLAAQNVRLTDKLRHAESENHFLGSKLREVREQLEAVTRPIWNLARICREPAVGYDAPKAIEVWRVTGRVHIALSVAFHEIRTLPRGQRESLLNLLVDDFASKARQHAIENFRVLLD